STGLSNTLLGLLTTLPLFAFGVVSTLTPLVTRRIGMEGTILGAMLLLTGGLLLRVLPFNAALFGGTLLVGIAIAFANVILPSLVKRDFPNNTGTMTSVYSGALGLGSTISAGISVPLAFSFNLGWHWALGSWALLSFLAFLLWIPQVRDSIIPKPKNSFVQSLKKLSSSKRAWQVACFMGLQSLGFYVILAWLPEILQDRGFNASTAGWLLSLSQGLGALGSLALPLWAEQLKDKRKLIWLIILMEIASLLALFPSEPFWIELWVSLIGFSLGGSFGLALLFIALRSPDSETATELSGMAQSIGYILAATGPIIFGALHDLSRNWYIPLLFLFVISILKLLSGLGAATPEPSK